MIPGGLVPAAAAAELGDALRTGNLARRLARAALSSSTIEESAPPDEAWLARELFAAAPPAPTAPYAWADLGGAASVTDQVWHLDPVHIAVGLDSAIVQSVDAAPPDAAESDALISAARDCLAAAGCRIERLAGRWFLHTTRAWNMSPSSLAAALGRPLTLASPDDGDALAWSRAHNMIQMSWHEHPVNLAREARGVLTVSGAWLHGGGTYRPLPALPWRHVASERAEVRGAARAAGATAGVEATSADRALLLWDDVLPASRTAEWASWRAAMARIEQRIAALPASSELDLILTGQRRVKRWRVLTSDRLRLWRSRSLAEACAE